MVEIGVIGSAPLSDQVAAVSCGLYQGEAVLDLNYEEDSNVQADANFVLTGQGGIVEIQTTAEHEAFSRAEFDQLLNLAEGGVRELTALQCRVLGL
jgi:ribonuclease PH